VGVITTEAATPITAHPRLATIVGVIAITVGVIATLVCVALVCPALDNRCCGGCLLNGCGCSGCGCLLSPRGCGCGCPLSPRGCGCGYPLSLRDCGCGSALSPRGRPGLVSAADAERRATPSNSRVPVLHASLECILDFVCQDLLVLRFNITLPIRSHLCIV
jgi:hypothetical protein